MSVRGRSQANRQRFGSSFLSSGRYMCAWVDDAATSGLAARCAMRRYIVTTAAVRAHSVTRAGGRVSVHRAGAFILTSARKLSQKPGSGETTELGACDEVCFRLRYI